MPTVRINPVEVSKENGQWKMLFRIEDGKASTMASSSVYFGVNNSSEVVGENLKRLLDLVDSKTSRMKNPAWPWGNGYFNPINIQGKDISDFDVTYSGIRKDTRISGITLNYHIITKVELTPEAAKRAFSEYGTDVVTQASTKKVVGNSLSDYSLQWEKLREDKDWNISGEVLSVYDGDTIKIKITQVGDKADGYFNIGETRDVRFLGIDAPEIVKVDERYEHEERNAKWAKNFNIIPEKASQIAKEALTAVNKLAFFTNNKVIIDLDTNSDGTPRRDVNQDGSEGNRLVGVVYKQMDTLSAGDVDDLVINLNTTLLASASTQKWVNQNKKEAFIPLAIIRKASAADAGYTRWDISSWEHLVSLGSEAKNAYVDQAMEEVRQQQKKQLEEELQKMRDGNGQTVREVKEYTVKSGGITLDAIVAEYRKQNMDTTADTIIHANNLFMNDQGQYVFEVGKVLFVPVIRTVPVDPNKIQFTSQYGDTIDNVLDFFPPKDDRRPLTTPHHVRIGDCQFIIPPLSIQANKNSHTSKIKTLRSKSSMIIGSGHTTTTLTMQLYFHDLESINGYEIRRKNDLPYDYVDGLRPLIAQFKKAPFLPIENHYINEVLGVHDVALVNLSVSTVPGFPHSLAATLTLMQFEHEAYMPHVEFFDQQINYPMLRWFYQQCMQSDRRSPYRTYLAPIEGQLTNDFYFSIAQEEALIERSEALKELRFLAPMAKYDHDIINGSSLVGRTKRDGDRIRAVKAQRERFIEMEKKGQIPKKFHKYDATFKALYGDTFKYTKESMFMPIEFEDPSLFNTKDRIYVKIESEHNKAMLPEEFIHNRKDSIYTFVVDADQYYINMIEKNGLGADKEVQSYKYNYFQVKEKADLTEGELPMEPIYISDLLITSMNVVYENSFSSVQVQDGESPTLQYLGAQDPYIQVTFETTNENAVIQIRDLIERADRLSREYRQGITSGFVGFENQLTRLFGVTTVMIETTNISTVPGFVNRYQIQMTLCGFNKTQKRSEDLEGVSAAGENSTMEGRYVSNDPASKDAIIIERKMKDLELYPDMELPTYDELNHALKYIDAGIKVYHNPNNAKYVDPDFYIATNWTFRSYLMQYKKANLDDESSDLGLVELMDFAGIVARMKLASKKAIELDEANLSIINSIDDRAKEVELKYHTYEGQFDEIDPSVDEVHQLHSTGVYTGTPGADATAFVKNKANLLILPDMETWASWNGYGNSNDPSMVDAYLTWTSSLNNPSGEEVYNEIYRLLDKHLSGYFYDDRQAPDHKIVNLITYGTIEEIAYSYYMYLKRSGDSRFSGAEAIEENGAIEYKHFNYTAGMVTRERLANYLKTIFYQESRWGHFSAPGVPKLSGDGTPTVGISQINLPWHTKGKDVSWAQRMSWDWKFNLEYGVQYYADFFKKAWKSNDINVRSRPWDWATRWYNYPSATQLAEGQYSKYFHDFKVNFEGLAKDSFDYSKRIGARFNSPDAKYATAQSPKSAKIFQQLNNLTDNQKKLVSLDRDTMINALAEVAYLANSTTDSRLTSDKDRLAKLSDKELVAVYEDTMPKIDSMVSLQWFGGAKNMSLADAWFLGPKAVRTAVEDWRIYKHSKEISEGIKKRLVSTDMPNELFKDMMTDMVEYDHRGRMLRAFPTFQMFIIDEGKWMSSYKLWDNLYGFNAIHSIDVHKSRKIAADTAVIKMTNLYSNLSNRRLEENYGDWSYSFWDNLIWGKPSEEMLKARQELVDGMMLQTGARIHLRIGYGSDASSLPVMFNGTITELDTSELVTIIAQGDGIELTNVISADPNEKNDGLLSKIVEPRDLLCRLMTSKGNWFKNVVNDQTDGAFFTTHPLGVMHFGNPAQVPKATLPFHWFDNNYGEAAQNIYSSVGSPTFSQWVNTDTGEEFKGVFSNFLDFDWNNPSSWLTLNWPDGDEMDVKLKMYGQTIWKVAQTLSYVSPDYIFAVHPFELRSTLFFGKPYYKLAYRYDSMYSWNDVDGKWDRTVTSEHRKPYQQFHMYNSGTDIIDNMIKASEEGMFTNVICTYDGKQTPLIQADYDIRFDKQKTSVVESPIVARWPGANFFTSEKQAIYYGCSTLRDYMKDMYKGSLVVLGDPTVKPYDMCHVSDYVHDMNGPFLVKDVTHHFSMETGFITSISPDAVVVIDDKATEAHAGWVTSAATGLLSFMLAKKTMAKMIKKMMGSVGFLRTGANWLGNATGRGLLRMVSSLPHDEKDPEFKNLKNLLTEFSKHPPESDEAKYLAQTIRQTLDSIEEKAKAGKITFKGKKLGKFAQERLLYVSKGISNNLFEKRNALAFFRIGGMLAGGPVRIAVQVLASAAFVILKETLVEAWRRKKKVRQALSIIPLQYQGRNFTAGLNGQKGLVVGTHPGKWDQFFMGLGYDGKDDWTRDVGKVLNYVFDPSEQDNLLGVILGDEEARATTGRGNIEYYRTQEDVIRNKFENE